MLWLTDFLYVAFSLHLLCVSLLYGWKMYFTVCQDAIYCNCNDCDTSVNQSLPLFTQQIDSDDGLINSARACWGKKRLLTAECICFLQG